jgi:dephospho-CoA kinase
MLILGITGGIATGKSTVTRMFADLGAPTSSADDIARDLLGDAKVLRTLEAAFPECIRPVSYPLGHPLYDGPKSGVGQYVPLPKLDTNALRRLIFADDDARKLLESITHPPIIERLCADIAAFRKSNTSRAAAIEIPLLFEAGLAYIVDKVIVASCDEETQLRRLHERLGIDRVEARRQISTQWPLADKVAAADVVIHTNQPLDDVRWQLQNVWNSL